jgi:CcmD family protein
MSRRMRSGLVIGWFYLACTFGLAASSHAHAQDAAEERATSFQSVPGAVKEDIAGGPLLLAAYAVVWLALFGYVFRLVRLHRGVEDSMARLERAVSSTPVREDSHDGH